MGLRCSLEVESAPTTNTFASTQCRKIRPNKIKWEKKQPTIYLKNQKSKP